MTDIFRAKTQDAFVIKVLFELLKNNLRHACFIISPSGIKMRMTDYHKHILIDLDLQAENFPTYRCKSEKIIIGVNTSHVYEMLKTIKKKDTLTLYINDIDMTNLYIMVEPKNNTRITTSTVKVQLIESLDIFTPDGYDNPVLVSSTEYQKMIKEMNNLGKTVSISFVPGFIKFISDNTGICSKNVTFGENVDDSCDMFTLLYDTEKLVKISKISGLSENMHIYIKNNLPILFKSSIGTLGKIMIYVKSKSQIDDEENEEKED